MAITPKSNIPSKKTLELMVYIASKMNDCPSYGSVILNKALYHIDGISYIKTGKKISEFDYIKQGRGPTPKPSQLFAATGYLEEAERLKKVEVPYYGFTQKKFIATDIADVNMFSSAEIDLINQVLSILENQSAFEASEVTHKSIAWKLANSMEPLPLYTYLLGSSEPEAKDFDWAESIIDKYEKSLA